MRLKRAVMRGIWAQQHYSLRSSGTETEATTPVVIPRFTLPTTHGSRMTEPTDASASLEGVLKDEILRMDRDVADNLTSEFHFFHGREAAELFRVRSSLRTWKPMALSQPKTTSSAPS